MSKKILYLTTLIILSIGLVFGAYTYSPFHVSAACGGVYSNCYAITIDHNKAGSTDTTNFAMLFSTSTMATLATAANSGQVQHTVTQTGGASLTVPADLIFTSDSACSVKLSWEFETYNQTTGAMNVWINIGTLSHTVDTVIYMCLNGSTTTWQGNVSGTWDTNYKGVWHLPDGSSLSATDSTSNGNNGTPGAGASATTGQVDGAVNLTGTNVSTTNVVFTNNSGLDISAGDWTIEGWVHNPSVTVGSGFTQIFTFGSTPNGLEMEGDPSGGTYALSILVNNTIYERTSFKSQSGWHHFVATRTGTTYNLYSDGALDNAASISDAGYYSGYFIGGGSARVLNGDFDEVRVSNSVRSADQILAEYNNQLYPGTFFSVGAEQSSGGGAAPVAHTQVNFNTSWVNINGQLNIQ